MRVLFFTTWWKKSKPAVDYSALFREGHEIARRQWFHDRYPPHTEWLTEMQR